MLNVFGSNYLIISEMNVRWLPSATAIPAEEPPKAVYSVWLMDALGIRAAVFLRCPTCQSPLGLSPSDATEQQEWNKKEPEINNIFGCAKCSNVWMLTMNKVYHLMVTPVPPQARTSRLLTMPPKGGMA